MTALYTEKDLKKLGAQLKKYAIICAVPAAVAVVVGVVVCFFVTEANAAALKTFNIIFSCVGFCAALYVLFNYVLPVKAKKDFVFRMVNSNAKKARGKFVGKGRKITVEKHLTFFEIVIQDASGKEQVLYFDSEIPMPAFEGHVVEFSVVNNKIVGYGDAV